MSRPFLKYIAYMQVITIVLVVLGHSFHEYPDGDMGRSMLIYRMLHSFRMPLFMFVSGLLLAYTTDTALQERRKSYISHFVKGKIRRLMIPFATLTAVTFVPRALMSDIADNEIGFDLISFARGFFYADSMPVPLFWFLQSSFTLLVVCFLYMAFTNRLKISHLTADIFLIAVFAVIMVLAPFGSFFSLDMSAMLGVYFAAGIAYCHFMPVIDRAVPWTSLAFLLTVTAAWLSLFFLFEGTDCAVFCSVAGIIMVMSLARIIESRRWRFLDHLLGANYIIFLLSLYFNWLTQQILSHFVVLPWYVFTILSIALGIYGPWIIYRKMLAHSGSRWAKVLAFVLGQSLTRRV